MSFSFYFSLSLAFSNWESKHVYKIQLYLNRLRIFRWQIFANFPGYNIKWGLMKHNGNTVCIYLLLPIIKVTMRNPVSKYQVWTENFPIPSSHSLDSCVVNGSLQDKSLTHWVARYLKLQILSIFYCILNAS